MELGLNDWFELIRADTGHAEEYQILERTNWSYSTYRHGNITRKLTLSQTSKNVKKKILRFF
jgi:hypothetical protein